MRNNIIGYAIHNPMNGVKLQVSMLTCSCITIDQ